MSQPFQQIGLYTLIRKLGEGGFGEVWLAENRNSSPIMTVAIKLPREDQIELSAVKDEIFNWILSGKHKNILPIIECEVFGSQVAIVSEFAPDGSLQYLLDKQGAFSILDSIEITTGILEGLTHLHNRKIIHRDLKPDNVLFQGRTPRLTDFGISRALTVTSQSQRISGTLSYMSPEAFDGKRNVQTDIWSVGVILYQLLSGRLPFAQKEKIEFIGAVMMKEPAPLPEFIPPSLQAIVKKSLAKSTIERYQTAVEMVKDLKDFVLNPTRSFFEPVTEPLIPKENQDSVPFLGSQDFGPTETSPNLILFESKKSPIVKTEQIQREFQSSVIPEVKTKTKSNKNFFVIPIIAILFVALLGGGYFFIKNLSNLAPVNKEKDVAAVVNGKSIKLEEVEKSAKQQAGEQWSKLSPLELVQSRLQVLQNLIQQEVMYQMAEKENTIPTDNEITAEFNKTKTASGMTAEEFKKRMEQNGETELSVREQLKKQLAVNKLVEKISGKIEPPKDSEIEAFFKGNTEAFIKKKGVKLSAIVVDPSYSGGGDKTIDETSAKLKIDEVTAKLNQGYDFAALAREVSEDESRTKDGDIGYISEEQLKQSYGGQLAGFMNPQFPIGNLAGPFQIDGKYYILKLIERNFKNENLTLESSGVRQQIADSLVKARKELVSQAYAAKILNLAKIDNFLLDNVLDNPNELSGARPSVSPNSNTTKAK